MLEHPSDSQARSSVIDIVSYDRRASTMVRPIGVEEEVAFSIGICASGDAVETLRRLIPVVQGEVLPKGFRLSSIIIVASEPSESTAELLAAVAAEDSRIVLRVEPERRGKIEAVNRIIRDHSGSYLVFVNADAVPEAGAITKLLLRISSDDAIGTVSACPTFRASGDLISRLLDFMWATHNVSLARAQPSRDEQSRERRADGGQVRCARDSAQRRRERWGVHQRPRFCRRISHTLQRRCEGRNRRAPQRLPAYRAAPEDSFWACAGMEEAGSPSIDRGVSDADRSGTINLDCLQCYRFASEQVAHSSGGRDGRSDRGGTLNRRQARVNRPTHGLEKVQAMIFSSTPAEPDERPRGSSPAE